MDAATQSTLYSEFKILIETLKSKPKKSIVFTLNELNCEDTKKFFNITIKLIAEGVHFAITKCLDKRIWDIIKLQLDIQVQSVSPDIDQEIQQFYNLRIEFLKNLIKTITNESQSFGPLNNVNQHREFLANLYCNAGELNEHMASRLKKMNCDVKNYYQVATAYYQKAISIFPFQGKYYFLLATISNLFQDTFNSICYLQKALFAQIAFNCKENMNEVFETNRKHYIEWAKHVKSTGENDKGIYLRAFMIYLIKFTTIVFTKIGFEELNEMTNMFKFLQEYFKIVKTNVHQDHQQQYTILQKIIMITNFGLHYSITTQQLKTISDIKENDLVRESIKYVYGLYVNSLDFILKYLLQNSMKNLDQVPPKTFLQLIIPIIYYLYDQPLICIYLLQEYPQLNDKLAQVYLYSRQNLYNTQGESVDLFKLQQKLNDSFHNCLFPFEIPLIGFTCYTHVLQTFKQNTIIQDDEVSTSILLFYVCEQIISKLHGIQLETTTIPTWEEDIKQELIKKLIVIDGMNVAMRYGQEQSLNARFCSAGLKQALEFWLKRGHDVIIILPDFCFNESEIQKKKETNSKNINKLPDDINTLIEMKQKGYAYGVPNWNYDDSYMIDYARKKEGYILTNDRYNDHIRSLESNIIERERLKEWIRNNCISYTFLQNELVPNPEFLKRM